MNLKLMGAILVILACGGCGLMMASHYQTKIGQLQALIAALNYMECELQYRCTPLPQLCRQAGERARGKIRQIFMLMAEEMEAQISPDAERCMACVLDKLLDVEHTLHCHFTQLGRTMGKFDMTGQLRGFESVRNACAADLEILLKNKDQRLRAYQTIGLCAGAAVAIIFV